MYHSKCLTQNVSIKISQKMSHSKIFIQNVSLKNFHSKCLTQNVSIKISQKMSRSKIFIQNVSLKMSHSKCLAQNISKMCHSKYFIQNVSLKISHSKNVSLKKYLIQNVSLKMSNTKCLKKITCRISFNYPIFGFSRQKRITFSVNPHMVIFNSCCTSLEILALKVLKVFWLHLAPPFSQFLVFLWPVWPSDKLIGCAFFLRIWNKWKS